MGEIPKGKLYFNKTQAAKHLKIPLAEIEALIKSGQLKTSTMGRLHLIPVSAMNAFLERDDSSSNNAKPQGISERLFSIEEAAKELGHSAHEVWLKIYLRKIPLKSVDNNKLISETSLISLRREFGISEPKTVESVYNASSTPSGRRGITRDETGEAPSTRDDRTPSSQPSASVNVTSAELDTASSRSSGNIAEKAKEDRRRVTEAAQRMGKSINQIRSMIAEGKLIVDPQTNKLVHSKNKQTASKQPIHKDQAKSLGNLKSNNQSNNRKEPKSLRAKPDSGEAAAKRVRVLEKQVQDLQLDIRSAKEVNSLLDDEKKRVQKELHLERSERQHFAEELKSRIGELGVARRSLDQLEAEIENLKRDRGLGLSRGDIRKEQAALKEAEQRAAELYQELAVEKSLRMKAEEALSEMRDLKNTLKLFQNKVAELESETALLAEIRRMLGGGAVPATTSVSSVIRSDSAQSDATVKSSAGDTLQIQTQYGIWEFRPPFELEEDDIEVLRLVAGEDEISTEQLKKRTNRKRAADDLDELLDKLLEEYDLEPIKSDNGRYWFEQAFLEDK